MEPAPRPPPAAREEASPIPYASRHLLPLPACPSEIREDCVVLEEPWNYTPSDVAQAGTDLIGTVDPLILRPESGLFLLALEIYQAGIRFLVEEPDASHVDELLRRIETDVLVTALLLRQMAGTVDI